MIVNRQFRGCVPIVENEDLNEIYASEVVDCDLKRDSLRPVNSDLNVSASIGNSTQTIWYSGSHWYQFDDILHIVKALDAISSKRVVISSGDASTTYYPKETDTALGDAGAGPWPAATRRHGMPAPSSAPVIVAGGTATGDFEGSYSWVYTYFYTRPDGSVIESAPSPPSDIFDAYDDHTTVTVGSMAWPSPAVAGVTYSGIRIYRMVSSSTGALFHFVHEQATVADWIDTVTDAAASLNAVLETMDVSSGISVYWSRPLDTLKGLTMIGNGIFVGFKDNYIYPSVTFVSYAYPEAYQLAADVTIKAIGYTGSMAIVLTESTPYLLLGQDPATLSLVRIDVTRPLCWPAKIRREHADRRFVSVNRGADPDRCFRP